MVRKSNFLLLLVIAWICSGCGSVRQVCPAELLQESPTFPRKNDPLAGNLMHGDVTTVLRGDVCSSFLFDEKSDSYWGVVSEINSTGPDIHSLSFSHKICQIRWIDGQSSVAVIEDFHQNIPFANYQFVYNYRPRMYIAAIGSDGPLIVEPELGLLVPASSDIECHHTYMRSLSFDNIPLAVSGSPGQYRCFYVTDDILSSFDMAGELVSEAPIDSIVDRHSFSSRLAGLSSYSMQPKLEFDDSAESITIASMEGFAIVDAVSGEMLAFVKPPAGFMRTLFYSSKIDSAMVLTRAVRGRQPGFEETWPGLFYIKNCTGTVGDPIRIVAAENVELGQIYDCIFLEDQQHGADSLAILFSSSGCWQISSNGVCSLIENYEIDIDAEDMTLLEVVANQNANEVLLVLREKTGDIKFLFQGFPAVESR